MQFNKKVSNAMLCGAIETMHANSNSKTHRIVLGEITKATFLCPGTVSLPPVKDKNGELRLQDGCQVQYKMLQDSQGRPLLMAFTSEEQMQLWKDKTGNQECYGFACSFPEYVMLILNKQPDGTYGPAQGFVVDPYGANLVIDRDKIANILIRANEPKRN